MHKTSPRVLPGKIAFTLIALLTCSLTLSAQPGPSTQTRQGPSTQTRQPARGGSPEQRTARHFETIRKSPPEQLAFLLKMPKGADLHNHLSGSIYAERYIEWAAANGLCINTVTMTLSVPPADSKCDPELGQPPVSAALTNAVLYRQLIDAWSMRNWQLSGQSGHDHFFDAFGRFGAATYNQSGRMLANAVTSAARGKVLYVELLLTPDGTPTGVMSNQIGTAVGWDGNFESTLNKLKSNGIANAAALGVKNLQDMEAEKDRLLKCGTPEADAGCSVTIRYLAQVGRNGALGPVFAQMVTGFMLANDRNSKVVALNLVQGEDGLNSMKNFSVHMQMLSFLRPLYPQAHLTLHAGELAPGLVPPDGLMFHIRDSVMTARAERIGHGVDIMHENEPYDLLKEMARRNVLVEICLSSNDLILGVSGARHPLATYMKYGVPIALATDDEGVARSEISMEFLKAAEEHGLTYLQLKTMARNSVQHAFLAGPSLWSNGRNFVPVIQCAPDIRAKKLTSNACRQYIERSEKAKLQWRLEEEFSAFERLW